MNQLAATFPEYHPRNNTLDLIHFNGITMLHLQDSISGSEILEMVNGQEPEGLYLEYKGHEKLDRGELKRVLSKYVSAFANADGGTIIFGVREAKGGGGRYPTIDGIGFDYPDVYSEFLGQSVAASVSPVVEDCRVFAVDLPEKDRYVIVITVQASARAPHQAKDGIYYRRVNRQSVPMEEYEIREKYLQNILAHSEYRQLLASIRTAIYKPLLAEIQVISHLLDHHKCPTHFERRYTKAWIRIGSSGDWIDLLGIGEEGLVSRFNDFYDSLEEFNRNVQRCHTALSNGIQEILGEITDAPYEGVSCWYEMRSEVVYKQLSESSNVTRFLKASTTPKVQALHRYAEPQMFARFFDLLETRFAEELKTIRTYTFNMRDSSVDMLNLLTAKIRATFPTTHDYWRQSTDTGETEDSDAGD